MNNKTMTSLGLLALLATIPAASAGSANLGSVTDAAADATGSLGSSHESAAASSLCYAIRINDPSIVAANVQFAFLETDQRWVAFQIYCPGVLIPAGCTLTFALSLAGATLWYVNYVYVTPVSPANEVSGAATYGGLVLGATLTYVFCI